MDRRQLGLLAGIALAAFAAAPAGAQDDTDLFTVAVPPNVLLLVDNSGSMNQAVWHPDFDPTAATSCNEYTSSSDTTWGTGDFNSSYERTRTRCGTSRTYYADPAVFDAGNEMRYDYRYLNWIHSLPNGDPRLAELAATANGTYSACLQADGYSTYSKYRRARVTAAQDVLREVICNVNQAGEVRFGLAQFRLPGGSDDPNGAFVRVPINDYDVANYSLNGSTRSHGAHLDVAIDALEGVTWTPLGESLFQAYTYFMSRTTSPTSQLPYGANGSTRFPVYTYRTTTGDNGGRGTSTSSEIPVSPVQYACQKNFVIVITDGEPTKDDFDNSNSSNNTSYGFSDFSALIGNYNDDGETESNGWACGGVGTSEECALYLDDVAKFMHENDFRPDLDGTQTIDVYTIGFSTTAYANDLLQRTATAGGGLFRASNNPEELTAAITDAVTSIIDKASSFTAAAVPATRTAAGGNIYTSLFKPTEEAYWTGELKLFQITSEGDILDQAGQCALLNPTPPGECKGGQVSPDADPWWDAGEEIPDPEDRDLYTSFPGLGRMPFTKAAMTYTLLGAVLDTSDDLTLADIAQYVTSGVTTLDDLKNVIVQNIRGCVMGTGLTDGTCVNRPSLLGDIFHSNPLVVGRPRSFINEASYREFANDYATRDTVIYAGSNAGFLHGFHAGEWQSSATPPAYDRGTGEELFGFMPWPVRQNARYLPLDTGSRDYYGVDGSPSAADVWFYDTATQTTKDADEWHTVLTGGLRQGGRAYYALDITDPDAGSYPGYLWEFPAEGASAAERAAIGETWGQPVITKVQVDIADQPYERWVAIVTGGYHATSDPNDALNYDASSTAGRGIYILDIETGEVLGEKKFIASETDGREDMLYAMPSTPSVFDTDLDGYADVIYVGDLGGNVWKWVIKWEKDGNQLLDAVNGSADVSQPTTKFRRWFAAQATASSSLGVTVGSTTYYKSIFYSPAGAFALNRFWLAFGTGERALLSRTHDASVDTENNRFYSVKDEDPLDKRATPIAMLTEEDLWDQSDDATCPNLASTSGFFFRVDDDEKFVTDTEVFGYWVITSTFTTSGSTDPCAAGGNASLYIFKLYCGEGFFYDTSTYSEGSGSLPGGGPGAGGGGTDSSLPDYGDPASRRIELGAGMPTDPRVTVSPDGTRVVVTQQDGEIENEEGPPGSGSAPGQLYWREVAQ
jgi:type IV pilus assembly protein PilY1